jgi:nucleotide-binding universal stress UspA family protein
MEEHGGVPPGGPGKPDEPGEPGDMLRPGPPAWLLAALAPTIAVALVLWRGVERSAGEPAPPWVVAVLTVVFAVAVAWRAVTQYVDLGAEGVVCRNVLVSFEVPWDRIESLEVERKAAMVLVAVRVRNLRRTHRLGAVTRFAGHEAEAVLDRLRAHPHAGPRLVEGPDGPPGADAP